ncbi:MAG: hypothetical protein LBN27_13130 [Prevotellaceae bacterium]|jgi:hypothetical protein|nr:hypothetical protein [Prevotellaceae bacterium]
MYYQDDTDTLALDCEYQTATIAYAGFDNPAVTGIIPAGYMTGDEFERRVKAELTQLYKANGI